MALRSLAMVRDARRRAPHHEASSRGGASAPSRRMRHTHLLILATGFCPRFSIRLLPPQERAHATLKRGRREDRVRAAPAVSCAMGNKEMRTRADRFGGGSPAFPAQWFDGICRALPGDRLFDTIAPGRREPPGNLTPALGASGPHGFAVRINAARLATPTRPPQPVPTSVTWPTPPLAGQDGRIFR